MKSLSLALTIITSAAAGIVPALSKVLPAAAPTVCSVDQRLCSLPGCAIAVQDCVGGEWLDCYCATPTCDDGNACTTDYASGSKCVHAAVSVDDGNPCTVDACDPAKGVTHTINAGAACDDRNACTSNDRCSASGVCMGTGTATTCDAFCYDKFGNVTQKITCGAGQTCGGCP